LSDVWPGFQCHDIFRSQIAQKRHEIEPIGSHLRCIEWWHSEWPWVTFDPDVKVTVFLKSNIGNLLLHTNRKLYLAYGMVLCLVTLTDLWRLRAGLSASAELLVLPRDAMPKRRTSRCPVSVCPSVCLSRLCIVPKRLKISSRFFLDLIAPSL